MGGEGLAAAAKDNSGKCNSGATAYEVDPAAFAGLKISG